MAATTVLPLPTSPCSRRCIGCGSRRSRRTSFMARVCALVRRKGKSFEKELEQRPVHLQHGSLPGAAAAVGEAHRKLLREELVELHAAPRRRKVAARLRAMQQLHALPEIGQIQALSQRLGQGVVERRRIQGLEHVARAARPGSARRWSDRSGSGPAAGARLRRRCGSADAPSRRRRSRAAPRRRRARAGRSRRRAETALAGSVEVEKAQHQPVGMDHELALGPVHDLRLEHLRLDADRLARAAPHPAPSARSRRRSAAAGAARGRSATAARASRVSFRVTP